MLPPVPRCSDWASSSLISPSRNISLPRNCSRVGLHIVLFEACSAFTRVAARTLAPSPICDQLHRRSFSQFRHLHDCSGCFRLECCLGGAYTHWKAPPSHTAHANSGRSISARRARPEKPAALSVAYMRFVRPVRESSQIDVAWYAICGYAYCVPCVGATIVTISVKKIRELLGQPPISRHGQNPEGAARPRAPVPNRGRNPPWRSSKDAGRLGTREADVVSAPSSEYCCS